MRVRHVEQAFIGLCAVDPLQQGPLDRVRVDVDRLRHLLWNGYHEKASEALGRILGRIVGRILGGAEDTVVVNGAAVAPKVGQLVAHCTELGAYIGTNADALIDHGQRYRASDTGPASRSPPHVPRARPTTWSTRA